MNREIINAEEAILTLRRSNLVCKGKFDLIVNVIDFQAKVRCQTGLDSCKMKFV